MKKPSIILALLLTFAALTSVAQTIDPEPVSGKKPTRDFVNRSIVYPEQDLTDNKSGKVVVDFVVDEQGKASQFSVSDAFSNEAAKNAIDIVKRIEWLPAQIDGTPVKANMQYEVVYNAKSYKRSLKKRTALPLTFPADTSLRIYENRQTDEWAYPYFKDGDNMVSYIINNLHYPEEAKQREVSGTVTLTFIIETDGNVSNIVITNHVGGGCDNEAIRLIEATRWIPAVKNGHYVRSRNKQDITFGIGAHNFIDGSNY